MNYTLEKDTPEAREALKTVHDKAQDYWETLSMTDRDKMLEEAGYLLSHGYVSDPGITQFVLARRIAYMRRTISL